MAAIALFVTVLAILDAYNAGQVVELNLWSFQPGIELAFSIEPLGLVFALVASSLWILTHIYGVGYMRGNKEIKHARFFACFAFAIFATMGIAFSANLLTLFLFYEFLTVSTYPLVAHKETPEAKAGGTCLSRYFDEYQHCIPADGDHLDLCADRADGFHRRGNTGRQNR